MGNANESEIAKRPCRALLAAGIDDAGSKDGIKFCTGGRYSDSESRCPYPVCVVVEATSGHEAAGERAYIAQQLHEHNVSVADIALILEVTERTVKVYLK